MKTLPICLSLIIILQGVSSDFEYLKHLSVLENIEHYKSDLCSDYDKVIGCNANCTGRLYCLAGELYNIDCYLQTNNRYCNPTTLACVASTTDCPKTPEPSKFVCPGAGYYPDIFNCSKFHICNGENDPYVVTASCVSNYFFDARRFTCDEYARCYNFSFVDGECYRHIGNIVRHPLNRRFYMLCDEEAPVLRACPKGEVFNTTSLKCVVDCSVSEYLNGIAANDECFYECKRINENYVAQFDCCSNQEVFDDVIKTCRKKF